MGSDAIIMHSVWCYLIVEYNVILQNFGNFLLCIPTWLYVWYMVVSILLSGAQFIVHGCIVHGYNDRTWLCSKRLYCVCGCVIHLCGACLCVSVQQEEMCTYIIWSQFAVLGYQCNHVYQP